MTAPRSYKTILRAIGRHKPVPANSRTVKKPGDLVIGRTDRPAHIITTA